MAMELELNYNDESSRACAYFLRARVENGGCYPEVHHWNNQTISEIRYVQKCLDCVKQSECGETGFILNNLASFVTGSILMMVGFYMWLSRKFQKPPYPLLAWTLIMQSFFFFSLCGSQTACFPWIYTLNLKSFAFLPSIAKWGLIEGINKMRSPEWLDYPWVVQGHILVYKAHYYIDYYQIVLSQNLNLLMNTLTFTEIYRTLYNPFKSRRHFQKYQLLLCLLQVITNFGLSYYFWSYDPS